MPRLARKKAETTDEEFLAHTRRIAAAAADHKALDVDAYDVRGLTLIADSFVICSAGSEPHIRAIFNAVRQEMKDIGKLPLHSEGELKGGWLVLDYGSVIFHVFRTEAREFYDLDGLWGDAPRIELNLD